MKRVEPLRLGEIIEEMMTRYADDPDVRSTYICSLWHKLAGPAISRYTTRVSLEGSTMHVYVQSASLKEQLGYLRATLTRQINDLLGTPTLTSIVIH